MFDTLDYLADSAEMIFVHKQFDISIKLYQGSKFSFYNSNIK